MRSAFSDSCLADTNLLVYSVDLRSRSKARAAALLLRDLVAANLVVLTSQVLSEFFNVATREERGDRAILTPDEAQGWVELWLDECAVLEVTGEIVRDAVRAAIRYRRSIWDALLWSTARANGISTILTEDLPGRSAIEGVRYLNPFARGFDRALVGL